jgi:endonuclease VIII
VALSRAAVVMSRVAVARSRAGRTLRSMPEGDTIHRTAAALRCGLLGHELTRVEVPRARTPLPALGSRVVRIEARGKHLLITTSDDRVVHTHQRMTGSWHLYRPRERWRKRPGSARVVLGTEHVTAVCFAAPIVEVLDIEALRRHPTLRALGPDLCDPGVDIAEVQRRLHRIVPPERSIGEALLDQRVACGIGNVYRCDVLFLHGIDPATPVGSVDQATRRALLIDAARLLQANLRGTDRTTVPGAPGGSLWVHGRGGAPCRRCGTAIEVERLGEQARYVYRCPQCQPRHAARTDPVRPGPD